MKKLLVVGLVCTLCIGCNSAEENTPNETPNITPISGEPFTLLSEQIDNRDIPSIYTVGVISQYKMKYSDNTYDTYNLDGVLEIENSDAHLSQHLNANGMGSTIDGYYYDNKLYATYNNINYYEDMELNNVKESMLAPLEPYLFAEDSIEEITCGKDEEGITNYIIHLNNEAANELFISRYDIQGIDQLDDYEVTDNQIIYRFDDTHYLGEETIFNIQVSYSNQPIEIEYTLQTDYLRFEDTKVVIDDALKEEHLAYVNYKDIDTDAIETETVDDDSPEDTVEETFKKRLVSRLNYEKEGNRYSNKFNENEGYIVDFDNKVFIYTNFSLDYSYSWKGDIGSMGGCSYNFANDTAAESCDDSAIETIKNAKNYLQMELYYCGLSLSELQAEN